MRQRYYIMRLPVMKDQVMELAKEAGIDMDGLSIELERSNVKDQLGKPLSARIEDALIY